ncbi:MAG: type II toxin-antitoxin system PemK/MazF family toxin [Dehalococcoidia bacterium]|nr:type II toxin-antitoxin system PemK/MazF family toxin [Dehalococcoidia bacterium]
MGEVRPERVAGTGFPRYGDIYDVDLEPVVGSETGKRRPALIVSNDINNEYTETVTVLPITGQPAKREYPFEVFVPKGVAGLTSDSRIKANQVRTLDKSRLVRLRGSLPPQYLPKVERALKIHLNVK